MFSANPPVTAAAKARVAELKRVHHHSSWMDVFPTAPVYQSASASALPPVAQATAEQIQAAYPPPPVHLSSTITNIATPTEGILGKGPVSSLKRPRAVPGRMPTPAEGEASTEPTMHFEDSFEVVDYLGRSFLEPSPALMQQAPQLMERVCQPPRTVRGVFRSGDAGADSGSSSSGVQLVQWGPRNYGHLLFAAHLNGKAFVWESATRKLAASYCAHTQPVKSLQVTSGAVTLSTGSVDGTVALWDVESGVCRGVLTNPEKLPVVQHLHHPSAEEHLLLVAVDRKVVLYDIRTSDKVYQREYTGHMGTIFNLTLLSEGSKMLTTAEDKTLRTWDFRIPVQIKQFADAGMHAITHVAHHPQGEYLAAQSLDNKIIVFKDEGAGKLKLLRRQEFSGHTISGTRCQIAFSRDGHYVSSGDISGRLFLWDWQTGKLVKDFKAHGQMLVSHAWHPLEPSRVVTSGWDGTIKNWV